MPNSHLENRLPPLSFLPQYPAPSANHSVFIQSVRKWEVINNCKHTQKHPLSNPAVASSSSSNSSYPFLSFSPPAFLPISSWADLDSEKQRQKETEKHDFSRIKMLFNCFADQPFVMQCGRLLHILNIPDGNIYSKGCSAFQTLPLSLKGYFDRFDLTCFGERKN